MNAIADREKTANLSPEEKKARSAERKAQREALKAHHGIATVDDIPAEVGAYLVEPPGIFMGRGAHPLRGRWKRRIDASDVTLNLDQGAPVPPGNWKKIVHERDSVWLASWYDALSQKAKYVWLADSSHLRQQQDQAKYLKAAKLEADLESVRQFIRRGMEDKSDRTRKVATVCHLIDRLAMRVGDEKDEDEADTVGASTLRVEHVQIGAEEIAFDFLGKDSIRWQKTIAITGPDDPLSANLRKFVQGKLPEDLLFDGIDSTRVNRFLGQALPGLTAKVFRTYHATTAVRDSLARNSEFEPDTPEYEKTYVAKRANLQAAITCNHKRTPPKTWEQSLANKEQALALLEASEATGEKAMSDKAQERLQERIRRARGQLELAKATRDYNLGTSLKNYIDPRVYRTWGESVDFDWKRLYTKALQRKFAWVEPSEEPEPGVVDGDAADAGQEPPA